jgi:hypothetical protein
MYQSKAARAGGWWQFDKEMDKHAPEAFRVFEDAFRPEFARQIEGMPG